MLKWLYTYYSMNDTPIRYTPSIQDRIAQRVREIVLPLDDWLDRLITMPDRFNPETFDVLLHFKKEKVSGVHARKITDTYMDHYKELKELSTLRKSTVKFKEIVDDGDTDTDENQLLESYMDVADDVILKNTQAYDRIFAACDYMIEMANANRKPRKKKPISKEKMIAKLQHCAVDDKLNLKSIDPIFIITAEQLWVYNVKTRKLGCYHASVLDPRGMQREGTGLTVKGTSIQGFDTVKSTQKTLRKPDTQLAEFLKCGSVKCHTFFTAIKSVEISLTGRVNTDTLLLKV